MILKWHNVTREQFEALVEAAADLCAAVETGGGTFPIGLAYRLREALTAPAPTLIRGTIDGEPDPDYDPRIDHPERYREGPV